MPVSHFGASSGRTRTSLRLWGWRNPFDTHDQRDFVPSSVRCGRGTPSAASASSDATIALSLWPSIYRSTSPSPQPGCPSAGSSPVTVNGSTACSSRSSPAGSSSSSFGSPKRRRTLGSRNSPTESFCENRFTGPIAHDVPVDADAMIARRGRRVSRSIVTSVDRQVNGVVPLVALNAGHGSAARDDRTPERGTPAQAVSVWMDRVPKTGGRSTRCCSPPAADQR